MPRLNSLGQGSRVESVALYGALQGGALSTTFTASQGLLLMTIPFVHFFDGLRPSHELNTIENALRRGLARAGARGVGARAPAVGALAGAVADWMDRDDRPCRRTLGGCMIELMGCDRIPGVTGVDVIGAVRARIEATMRADRIPGLSMALVRADGSGWQRGFGVTDLISATPATARTPYLWFSMTKIVTATAAVRLAGLGALDLDAPVTEYFPPFAVVRQPRPVTVRHLLSHSSGLANPLPIRWVRAADAPGPDSAAFVERLLARHHRLKYVPGARASYSNLGYLVLGEVIAAASGAPFEEHIRLRVLPQMGMGHTGFTYADVGDERPATGYQRLPAPLTPLLRAALPSRIVAGRQGRYVAYHPFYVLGAAYGGLVGGVADAARLALIHLNDGAVDGTQLLPPGLAAQMRQITLRGGPLDIGLGWYRPAGQDSGFVEHLGGGSGFWNVIRLYPSIGLGVVVMGNTTRYHHEAIMAAATAMR